MDFNKNQVYISIDNNTIVYVTESENLPLPAKSLGRGICIHSSMDEKAIGMFVQGFNMAKFIPYKGELSSEQIANVTSKLEELK